MEQFIGCDAHKHMLGQFSFQLWVSSVLALPVMQQPLRALAAEKLLQVAHTTRVAKGASADNTETALRVSPGS